MSLCTEINSQSLSARVQKSFLMSQMTLYVWVRRETNLDKFVTKVPFSNELDSRSLIRYSPFPRESDRGLSVYLCNLGINIDIGCLSLLRNFPLHFFRLST